MQSRKYAAYTALACMAFYFFPTLSEFIFDHHKIYFLTIGDNRQLWLPAFIEGYDKFWGGGLFASDLLTGGGSSIFGLRANLSVIYPPFIATYLLLDVRSIPVGTIALGILTLLHVGAAAYSTHRIATRIGLSSSTAFFVSFSFVTSITLLVYLPYILFFFQATLVPVIILSMMKFIKQEKYSHIILFGTMISYLLTGYPPMLGMGLICSLFVVFILSEESAAFVLRRLARAALFLLPALPFVCIYYIGQYDYFQNVPARFAESNVLPGHILPLSSDNFLSVLFASVYPTQVEGRYYIGIFAFVLISVTLLTCTNPRFRKIIGAFFALSLAYYFLSLGKENWLSDVFYSVPVFGTMHIYQRYILFTLLPMSIATGISLEYIRLEIFKPNQQKLVRVLSAAILIATLFCAIYVSETHKPGIWPTAPEIIEIGLAIFLVLNMHNEWRMSIFASLILSLLAVHTSSLFPRLQSQLDAADIIYRNEYRTKLV